MKCSRVVDEHFKMHRGEALVSEIPRNLRQGRSPVPLTPTLGHYREAIDASPRCLGVTIDSHHPDALAGVLEDDALRGPLGPIVARDRFVRKTEGAADAVTDELTIVRGAGAHRQLFMCALQLWRLKLSHAVLGGLDHAAASLRETHPGLTAPIHYQEHPAGAPMTQLGECLVEQTAEDTLPTTSGMDHAANFSLRRLVHVDAAEADDLAVVSPEEVARDVVRPPPKRRVLQLEATTICSQAGGLEFLDGGKLLFVEAAGNLEVS